MCTPDTVASVPQSRHLPPPYQYAHVTVNAADDPRITGIR
jgi:hypothetical protein